MASADPLFTLTRAAVRDLDRRAIHDYGVPGVVLMENAGRGAAELLMRLNPERRPVVILCGPGNNGGDGFVIARHLDNHGWPVEVHSFAPEKLTPDAAAQFRTLDKSGVRLCHLKKPAITDWALVLRHAFAEQDGWVIDALFGTGLTRPLSSPYSDVAAGVDKAGYPVLAVDIPSGLDCDSGEPLGPTVRAAHTATFVAPKKGFANPNAREWTGEVHVIDIGAPRKLVDEYRGRRTV